MRLGPETFVPRTREPLENSRALTRQDPIRRFLIKDFRWRHLPRDLQELVATTADDVHNLTPEELLGRCEELDHEIPHSPYLTNIITKTDSSTLMDIYTDLTEMLDIPSSLDDQKLARVPPRLTQLHLAGRTIGREIEKKFGWNQTTGFGQFPTESLIAINLCIEAVETIPPPKI